MQHALLRSVVSEAGGMPYLIKTAVLSIMLSHSVGCGAMAGEYEAEICDPDDTYITLKRIRTMPLPVYI